ncbi:MAG: hypothetical protein U0798_01290 [Gemmataceae bacterium]
MRTFLFSIALFGSSALAFDKPKPAKSVKPVFEMSKETTVILEPLDKFGYPDYETALNLRLRGSIKPKDNACVKLWQALGPKTDTGKPIPAKYWEWLECKAPPEKGEYFIPSIKYLIKIGKTTSDNVDYDLDEKLSREPWNSNERPDYANWLKLVDKPLDITVEAVLRKSFYSPFASEESATRGSQFGGYAHHLQHCRLIGDALLKRAMFRTNQNQLEIAWNDLLACHRLAYHVASNSGFIGFLVGNALEIMACRADFAFLEYAKPRGELLARIRNDLDALPQFHYNSDQRHMIELYYLLDFVCNIRSGGIEKLASIIILSEDPRFVDIENNRILDKMNWSDTFLVINQKHSQITKILQTTNRPLRMKRWKEYEAINKKLLLEMKDAMPFWNKDLQEGIVNNSTGSFIGNYLFLHIHYLWICQKIESAGERKEQIVTLNKLAFALAAYHEAKGAYPDKLDQLVPTFVKTMPVDLYSGKAPIYRKTEKGYIVYSVGLNEKDDGGKLITDLPNGNEPRGDDIGIRMPSKE